MIDATLLDKCHALRGKHCRCGFVGVMPQFHADLCPYKPLGEQAIREAEAPSQSCNNCRHEDAPKTHPKCSLCIQGTTLVDGWEPKEELR